MSEILSFYVNDADKYGEEIATVLGMLRQTMLFYDPGTLEFDGIKHIELSQRFFESYLPYKPWKRTKMIIRKLQKLNVISIKEGNYYAVID